MKKIYLFLLLPFILFSHSTILSAETNDTLKRVDMPQIEVIAQKSALLNALPGSAGKIGWKEMQQVAPVSGNELFRRICGIHVVEEEGAGLRMNLSVRGLDPDRSRNVLVLEDGIPVALNPYGEPELYYTPLIDRMSGVEVLKGSGQLLFGPQTIGGVVNFITKDPPPTPQGRIKATAGQGGFASVLAAYGATHGSAGYQVNYLHKRADQLGYSRFRTHDFSAKFRMALSEKSTLGIKLGYYHEESNATYIGLTQPMYEQAQDDFVRMAPDDLLQIKRSSASATHQYRFSERLKLQTTVFAYSTTRDWARQDFGTTLTTSNQNGVIWGDTAIAGGAVYMRNQNAHRNRQFEVVGAEPRLVWDHRLFGASATLQTGLRLVSEKAYEQRINGKKADAQSGELVEDEIRTGKALSLFAQQQVQVSKNLSVHGGVRTEYYDYTRNILRNTFTVGGTAQVRDTNIIAGRTVQAVLPGVGVNLNLSARNTLFAGIHRGFAPPRVKDAVSAQGQAYMLEAEKSWNTEIGTRGQIGKWLNYEMTLFNMNFSNQVIPVSESSGGSGAGLVNGGQTVHRGVELGWLLDLAQVVGCKKWAFDWKANVSLQQAYFSQDRFQQQGTETINVKGYRTPYSPTYVGSTSLHLRLPMGLGAQLSATFTGDQYTDMLNTEKPSADGRIGKLDAYELLDVNLYYQVPKTGISLNASVKNLTDERYISSRRPQGIRVGNPRMIFGGIDIRF